MPAFLLTLLLFALPLASARAGSSLCGSDKETNSSGQCGPGNTACKHLRGMMDEASDGTGSALKGVCNGAMAVPSAVMDPCSGSCFGNGDSVIDVALSPFKAVAGFLGKSISGIGTAAGQLLTGTGKMILSPVKLITGQREPTFLERLWGWVIPQATAAPAGTDPEKQKRELAAYQLVRTGGILKPEQAKGLRPVIAENLLAVSDAQVMVKNMQEKLDDVSHTITEFQAQKAKLEARRTGLGIVGVGTGTHSSRAKATGAAADLGGRPSGGAAAEVGGEAGSGLERGSGQPVVDQSTITASPSAFTGTPAPSASSSSVTEQAPKSRLSAGSREAAGAYAASTLLGAASAAGASSSTITAGTATASGAVLSAVVQPARDGIGSFLRDSQGRLSEGERQEPSAESSASPVTEPASLFSQVHSAYESCLRRKLVQP